MFIFLCQSCYEMPVCLVLTMFTKLTLNSSQSFILNLWSTARPGTCPPSLNVQTERRRGCVQIHSILFQGIYMDFLCSSWLIAQFIFFHCVCSEWRGMCHRVLRALLSFFLVWVRIRLCMMEGSLWDPGSRIASTSLRFLAICFLIEERTYFTWASGQPFL